MTEHNNITQRLIQLAGQRFGKSPESLKPEDDMFQTLGIDSFKAMELLSQVETEFAVEIPDYELHGVYTFGALAELIQRRV